MDEMIERARRAASLVVDDVEAVSHVETLPTGVRVFAATCRGRAGRVTVTLNPNGLGAGVEWRHKTKGNGYRVIKIQGLVVPESENHLADHVEVEVVGRRETTQEASP